MKDKQTKHTKHTKHITFTIDTYREIGKDVGNLNNMFSIHTTITNDDTKEIVKITTSLNYNFGNSNNSKKHPYKVYVYLWYLNKEHTMVFVERYTQFEDAKEKVEIHHPNLIRKTINNKFAWKKGYVS